MSADDGRNAGDNRQENGAQAERQADNRQTGNFRRWLSLQFRGQRSCARQFTHRHWRRCSPRPYEGRKLRQEYPILIPACPGKVVREQLSICQLPLNLLQRIRPLLLPITRDEYLHKESELRTPTKRKSSLVSPTSILHVTRDCVASVQPTEWPKALRRVRSFPLPLLSRNARRATTHLPKPTAPDVAGALE